MPPIRGSTCLCAPATQPDAPSPHSGTRSAHPTPPLTSEPEEGRPPFRVQDMIQALGILDNDELAQEVKAKINALMRNTYDPHQTFTQPGARSLFNGKIIAAYPRLLAENRANKLHFISIYLGRQFASWRRSVSLRSRSPTSTRGFTSRPSSPTPEPEIYSDHVVPVANPDLGQFSPIRERRRAMTSALSGRSRPATPATNKQVANPQTPRSESVSTPSQVRTYAEWRALRSVPPTPTRSRSLARTSSQSKLEPPPAEQVPRFPSLTPEPSSVAGSSASQPVDASPTRPSTPAGVRNIDDTLARDLDGILHFLKCCKPPMDRLLPAFIPLGCTRLDLLSAVPDWDPDSILSFFLALKVPPGCGQPVTTMEAWILRHHVRRYFETRGSSN